MAYNNSTVNNTTGSQSDTDTNFMLYFVGIQGILAVPIISGNLLVLLSWLKFNALRKRSHILVVFLALSDLMVGIIMIPYNVFSYVIPGMSSTEVTCTLRYTFYCVFLFLSITNMLAVSVERYIAIVYPFQYIQHMSERKIVVTVVVLWLLNIAYCILPLLGWSHWKPGEECIVYNVLTREYRIILYMTMCSCLLLNLCLYSRVACVVMRRMSRPSQVGINHISHCITSGTMACRHSNKDDVNHTKVMIIVLGLFIICWMPFIVLATTEAILGHNIPGLVITKTFLLGTGIANSGINWVIYGWKNKQFRKGFKEILCYEAERTTPNQEFVGMHQIMNSTNSSRQGSILTISHQL